MWLIVAGGLLVGSGFIGLVFSRLGHEVHPVLDEIADDPVELPVWFSTDKKAFGRATAKQTGTAAVRTQISSGPEAAWLPPVASLY